MRFVRVPLLLGFLALAGCAGVAAPSEESSPTTPAASKPAIAEPPESPPARSALELLECDGTPSEVGGQGEGMAIEGAGESPDDALAAFLANTFFVVPRDGYEPLARAGDRHAYGFRSEGEVKVVVVISGRFADIAGRPYSVDELRTCPQAEFGRDAEFNDGRRIWTHEATGLILTDIPGPGHCEWQSARMLHVPEADGSLKAQYLRDPEGVFAGVPLRDTFSEDADLPPDASDSGYRTDDGLELWFSDEDRAAYVVTPDGVERWPRAEEPIGCA